MSKPILKIVDSVCEDSTCEAQHMSIAPGFSDPINDIAVGALHDELLDTCMLAADFGPNLILHAITALFINISLRSRNVDNPEENGDTLPDPAKHVLKSLVDFTTTTTMMLSHPDMVAGLQKYFGDTQEPIRRNPPPEKPERGG